MILMPPGSAKSTYCSVVLPAFLMGRNPGTRIILASYGTDLARKHGRRARAIVRSARYQKIFGTTLEPRAKRRRRLGAHQRLRIYGDRHPRRPSPATAPTGSSSTIRSRAATKPDSELIRARTREGYEDDLKTRLVPGGWIILIQTRWHEDDLAGSILPEGWAGESGPIRCRDGAHVGRAVPSGARRSPR